ncbi:carboxy terminal-processing peptidase [Compostibacter hankyongensis]|uniref:Carboxy terminal-processing peptidase n=1 Tax=Compostibacter hankyongensis TaxID=1007089 RepID=A0ABP8G3A4_9BACT
MRLKFIVPALLVSSAVAALAFGTYKKHAAPPGKDEAIVALIGQVLKQGHYDPKDIDDKFSQTVFNKYIDQLDGEKKFFLQPDISYLRKYEHLIDNEINGEGRLGFIRETDSIFDLRFRQARSIYPVVLEKPFDFTKKDSIQLDRDKTGFPASAAEARTRWEKMMKYRTLDKLVELQEMKAKAKTGDTLKTETPQQLEADARQKVKRIYDLYFDRMHSHLTEDDRFSMFVNVITTSMDPHTDYMAPAEKRYFDEQMSGTFFGVGAVLRQDEDKVKVESIVTGGPAWKEGELKAGDVILKVGQAEKEPEDLTGYTTQDAVKLIRGEKGTVVKLTVKQVDGSVKTIAITRGEVKQDDTFARSYTIGGKHKIGFIVLPEFYFSSTGRTGPGSSAYDVAKEIKKLKAEKVEGIVLDLRFNGGGSLGDAIDIAGLFIPQGPIVQVRSRNGNVDVLKDRDPAVAYDGPLAIMVNEYSASASEILAAAMQDYKRAVIIGSPSTYGKGTVQRMFDLNDFLSSADREKLGDLGAIKLTIQKFYRVNGGSTQRKGVTPDIILKDPYYDIAEKTDSAALPWDEISKAAYVPWKDTFNTEVLRKGSAYRVAHNPAFQLIGQNLAALKKIDDNKVMSLNMQQFKAEQKADDSELKQLDKVKDVVTPLSIANLPVDLSYIRSDSVKVGRNRDLLKLYEKDPYLMETLHVMDDMIDKPTLQNAGKLSKN